jgi:hypothetical protein
MGAPLFVAGGVLLVQVSVKDCPMVTRLLEGFQFPQSSLEQWTRRLRIQGVQALDHSGPHHLVEVGGQLWELTGFLHGTTLIVCGLDDFSDSPFVIA